MVATIIMIFISCSKEELLGNPSTEGVNSVVRVVKQGDGFNTLEYKDPNSRTPGTTILEFTSLQAFQDLAEQLQNDVDAWDDAFVAQWDFLNEDDLDAKEIEIGFDDQKPLTDFENQNDFYSLRNQFYDEENAWLDNEVLDESADPNDKEIYNFDDVEMALMNAQGEVKVGQTIYKYVDSGTLKILDGDFTKLIQYNDGDTTVVDNTNVIFEERSSAPCRAMKEVSDYRYFSGNTRRVKRKVNIRSTTSYYARFRSKIISYKKKNNGRWRRKRMWMSVAVQTYTFCSSYSRPGFSGWKTKKRKQLAKYMTHWNNPGHLRARRNGSSVKGYYQYAGYSNSKLLAW